MTPPPAPSPDPRPARRVAVIGAGPRGIAVIERLVAASSTAGWDGPLDVHLVDPHVDHGGAVWRIDQPAVLLMNTATCQTTLYPDASCRPRLPVPRAQTLADFLAPDGLAPADIAPRAAHGRYLMHVLERAEADADPQRVRIHREPLAAVDLTGPADGPQRVHLADGRELEVDAVVLALGHLATAPTLRSRRAAELAAAHHLVHLPAANPLEVDHTALLGRERVAVQGMGLNFYDLVGLLTDAAGGRFVPDDATPSGLRYLPGGGEPHLVVGSRSGMVYRPKPDLRPELPAPYTPQVLTDAVMAELIARDGGLEHERDTLPLMVQELCVALREAGFEALAEHEAIMRVLFPLGRRAQAVPEAHARTRAILREALAAAADPDPAWVLIFRVLGALRGRINRLADLGAYTAGSLTRDVDGFLKNAFASWASGPPVLRVRQVLALEEAGLVTFTGPGFDLGFDEDAGRFTVRAGDGPRLLCDGMVEAHLPGVDLERYDSPLITALRARGEIRQAVLPSLHGEAGVPTGSIDVADRCLPLAVDGTVQPRRILLGIPVSAAQPGSAITAEPGTSPQLLRGAEDAAIRLARVAGALPGDDAERNDADGDDAEEDDVPWALQIVVHRDRHHPAAEQDVCAAAARAVVRLLDDPRSAPGGPWHEPVARWRDGQIRKLVRRADGKRWEDVQELPGVTVDQGGQSEHGAAPAAARALVPGPTRPLPKALDKLQVSGTSFTPDPRAAAAVREAPVTLEVSPLVALTSGKKAAQCAHAAQLAYEAMDAPTRDAWRRAGFAVRIVHPEPRDWEREDAPVRVIDAGFTELEGPAETARARWTVA